MLKTLIIIGVVVLLIVLFFSLVKALFKVVTVVVTILVILLLGIGYLTVTDVMEFKEEFPVSDRLFLLKDGGPGAGYVLTAENKVEALDEGEMLGVMRKSYSADPPKGYYKIIVFREGVFEGVTEKSVVGVESAERRGEIFSEMVDDLVEYASEHPVDSVLRKGGIEMYPRTISVKLIESMPLEAMIEALKKEKEEIGEAIKESVEEKKEELKESVSEAVAEKTEELVDDAFDGAVGGLVGEEGNGEEEVNVE